MQISQWHLIRERNIPIIFVELFLISTKTNWWQVLSYLNGYKNETLFSYLI